MIEHNIEEYESAPKLAKVLDLLEELKKQSPRNTLDETITCAHREIGD